MFRAVRAVAVVGFFVVGCLDASPKLVQVDAGNPDAGASSSDGGATGTGATNTGAAGSGNAGGKGGAGGATTMGGGSGQGATGPSGGGGGTTREAGAPTDAQITDANSRDGSDASGEAGTGGGKAKGVPCGATKECGSGLSCADGYCCDAPCADSCHQCNLPKYEGTCTPVPVGAKPDKHTGCAAAAMSACGNDGTCDGAGHCREWAKGTTCSTTSCDTATGQLHGVGTCNGTGTCTEPTAISCAPFACKADGSGCRTACTVATDCASGTPCVGGSCGKIDNGRSCTGADQCKSSVCVDGICCSTACDQACQACTNGGATPGTCAPISGADALCTPAANDTCVAGACLKKDAQPCAVPSECASNACTPFYHDADHDTYGTDTAVYLCGSTAPAGFATRNGDCCDTEAQAFPGQNYFNGAALPVFGKPRAGCGGYDYDCSGAEEKLTVDHVERLCFPGISICSDGVDATAYNAATCGQALTNYHGCKLSADGQSCVWPTSDTLNVPCE
jgi:hypothetical protein